MTNTYPDLTVSDVENGIQRLIRLGLSHVETDIKRNKVSFQDSKHPRIEMASNLSEVAYGVQEPFDVVVRDE